MIQRNGIAAADQPLIQLRQVSKRFTMHHEQQRSFQETFIRFIQRKRERGRQFWALKDVSLEVRAGRLPWDHRSERRRQEHACSS